MDQMPVTYLPLRPQDSEPAAMGDECPCADCNPPEPENFDVND